MGGTSSRSTHSTLDPMIATTTTSSSTRSSSSSSTRRRRNHHHHSVVNGNHGGGGGGGGFFSSTSSALSREEHEQSTILRNGKQVERGYMLHLGERYFNERYLIRKKIGEGMNSDVYVALDQELNEYVALKVIPVHSGKQTREQILNEIEIMRRLKHDHIVQLKNVMTHQEFIGTMSGGTVLRNDNDSLQYNHSEKCEYIVIVSEYCNMGSIGDYLEKDLHLKLPIYILLKWMIELIDVLYYCHVEKQIIHRDIKPYNILLSNDALSPHYVYSKYIKDEDDEEYEDDEDDENEEYDHHQENAQHSPHEKKRFQFSKNKNHSSTTNTMNNTNNKNYTNNNTSTTNNNYTNNNNTNTTHHASIRSKMDQSFDSYEYINVKLGDFGLSKAIQSNIHQVSLQSICGTPLYCASEIVFQKGYSYNVDIYSLGVTLFELFSGHSHLTFLKIVLQNYRPISTLYDSIILNSIRRLIGMMIEKDSSKRLTSEQLIVHPIIHAYRHVVNYVKNEHDRAIHRQFHNSVNGNSNNGSNNGNNNSNNSNNGNSNNGSNNNNSNNNNNNSNNNNNNNGSRPSMNDHSPQQQQQEQQSSSSSSSYLSQYIQVFMEIIIYLNIEHDSDIQMKNCSIQKIQELFLKEESKSIIVNYIHNSYKRIMQMLCTIDKVNQPWICNFISHILIPCITNDQDERFLFIKSCLSQMNYLYSRGNAVVLKRLFMNVRELLSDSDWKLIISQNGYKHPKNDDVICMDDVKFRDYLNEMLLQ
nr:unnamed protein product [Naegleria fowleri]